MALEDSDAENGINPTALIVVVAVLLVLVLIVLWMSGAVFAPVPVTPTP
jgi:uncharacterized membrane protein YqiK